MVDVEFPLTKGMLFLNENRKSQNRMDAQTMHDKLLKYVEVGDIEVEDIPKTSMIQNWLNTYARAFK
ncbi:28122_t:CDS:2 [Gigaspora margarita]|uniref:28122_t:CDS:1 n=1 Tax=Gigaspora margarita TaxID=4874 RepID=A0ABN7UJA5_GIGMA|nr:28122_t:CDS:2 [Gigaspora margarita]